MYLEFYIFVDGIFVNVIDVVEIFKVFYVNLFNIDFEVEVFNDYV